MNALISWLAAAPQGAIAIVTAVLAAVVALLVALLTQWILGRRARTELLTKKLEELYLALNEISAHNVKRVEEALPLTSATPFSKPNISGGSVERQGLDLHKKIIMLVRLYFPQLSAAHQEIFHCNNGVNLLIYEAETGPPLSEDKFFLYVVPTAMRLSPWKTKLSRTEESSLKTSSCLVGTAMWKSHRPSPHLGEMQCPTHHSTGPAQKAV